MEPEATMADALARQMAGQWQGLMQLMTQQGASRDEIAVLALSVSVVVLTTTADALWGSVDPNSRAIPTEEFAMATTFVELETILNGKLEEVNS